MASKPPKSFREIAGAVRPLPPSPERIRPLKPITMYSDGERVSKPLMVRLEGELVSGNAENVPPSACPRLQRGLAPPQARLDGHGLTVAEMRQELIAFIRHSRLAGYRTVLIVHGRGLHSGPEGPQLKETAIQLLSERLSRHVLAFSSAPAAWGGYGATVVRLRRSRGIE